MQGKKELIEAEALNAKSEETIGRLKAEIEVAKGAAHIEMEKCKTITESRFEVLKTENDRLETLIRLETCMPRAWRRSSEEISIAII